MYDKQNIDAAMSLLAQKEAVGLHASVASYTYLIEAHGNVDRTLEVDIIFQAMISFGCKPGTTICSVLQSDMESTQRKV